MTLIHVLGVVLLFALVVPRPTAAQEGNEAEYLALRTGEFDRTTLRADPEATRAIAALLARIRKAHPDVGGIRAHVTPGTQLMVMVDTQAPACTPEPTAAVADLAGRFGGHVLPSGRAAGRPSERSRRPDGTAASSLGTVSMVLASFPDRLHVPSLAAQFQSLPCVRAVAENEEIGVSSIVTLARTGDERHVAMGRGSGDCMAGCINWAIAFFVARPDGSITRVADWRRGATGETGHQPWPVWPRRQW